MVKFAEWDNDVTDLRRAMANAWRLDKTLPVSTVVDQNYRLSRKSEGDPGAYNLFDYPYWTLPLNLWIDRVCRRITIMKSIQVGGTLTFQGAMLATSIIDPSPIMYVLPTEDEAIGMRDRIYTNALASSQLFRKMVPQRRSWNKRSLDLGNMKIYLAWSKSLQRVRGKPCKRVLRSESDVFARPTAAGDSRKASDGRMTQFFDYCSCDESSPVGSDSYIAGEYDRSNQMAWWCCCPHCGFWQMLRFFPFTSGRLEGRCGVVGFRDDKNSMVEPAIARQRAYYRCANGCKIGNDYKSLFVKSGIWVPAAVSKTPDIQEKISAAKAAGRLYVEGADMRHCGFHVWTMMSHKKTFGDIAASYIDHIQAGKLRDFWQNILGRRFASLKKIPKYQIVAKKFNAGFDRGTCPKHVWFLTGGIDVQKSFCPWLIVGWSWGRTPWLIDWGECHQDEIVSDDELAGGVAIASDLLKLENRILQRLWPVVGGANLLNRTSLECRLAGLDTKYRMHQVHNYVSSLETSRIRHVFGDHNVSRRDRWAPTTIERSARDGKAYEGGLSAWRFNKAMYQEGVDARLAAPPGMDASFRLPNEMESVGEKVLRQITNVRETTEEERAAGERDLWKCMNSGLGEDYRDCFVICELCADMVVCDIGWSELNFMEFRDQYLADQARAAGSQQDESIME